MILCDCYWCLTPDDLYCPQCGQCVVLFGNEPVDAVRQAPIDLYGYRINDEGGDIPEKNFTKYVVKKFVRHRHQSAGGKYSGFSFFDQIMGKDGFREPGQVRLSPHFGKGILDVQVDKGFSESQNPAKIPLSLEHPFLFGRLNFYFHIVKEPQFGVVFGKYNTGLGSQKFAFAYYWENISRSKTADKTFVAILPYYLRVVSATDGIDDFQIDRPKVDVVANDKKIVLLKKDIVTPEDFAKKNTKFASDSVSLGFADGPNTKIRLVYIEFKINSESGLNGKDDQKLFEIDFQFEFVWKYKNDFDSGSNSFSQNHKVVLLKPDKLSLYPDISADRNTDLFPVSTRGHREKNFIARISFTISSGSDPIIDRIRACPFYLNYVSLDLADENLVINTFDLADRPFIEMGLSSNDISFEEKVKVSFSLNQLEETRFSEGYDLVSTIHFYATGGWKFASEKISLRFEKFKIIHEFVCFDFGTTNSCAVYWENSDEGPEPVYLQWGEGETEISSVVCANDHSLIDKAELNGWTCGKSAEKTLVSGKIDEFGIRNFKKLFQNSIVNRSDIKVVDIHNCTKAHDSEVALAGVLKQFIFELENANMVKFTNIGFTFPTKWDLNTVNKFNSALNILRKDKFLKLNIKVPEFDEGISVVFADYHGLSREKKQKKTLFISYDLGGGTLDIAAAIMWQTRKGLNWEDHGRLVGYAGDNTLGGDLITEIISKMICDSIIKALSNEDSISSLIQSKKGLVPDIGKFDYNKSRIFFPNYYSSDWSNGSSFQFDAERTKKSSSHNSKGIYKIADKIKNSYFQNIKSIIKIAFSIDLFVSREENDATKITYHNLEIAKIPDLFPGTFDLTIDLFLSYQFGVFGNEITPLQKFYKSNLLLKKFIVDKFDDVDNVRIIIAGNGSRFQLVTDTIGKIANEIAVLKKTASKIEIIRPDENAKKLAALGYAKKMSGKMAGDFFPVYSVIQNPLYFTRTDTEDPDLKQIFENVFMAFEPFGKDILTESPSFFVLKSKTITIILEDQYMASECLEGHEFSIFSEKMDISEYVVAKVLVPANLNPLFKKTRIVDGIEYPCVDLVFELNFSKFESDTKECCIRTELAGYFLGPEGQKLNATLKDNIVPDSDKLSKILLMEE